MARLLVVSRVRFSPADPEDQASGLLGFASCVLDDALHLDGLAVRRSLQGRVLISYPSRRDRRGRAHAPFRPFDDAVRREVERQLIDALLALGVLG